MWGDASRTERAATQYLPYIGHIGPQTLLLENGALLAMANVEGQAFELADHAARNARLRLLNTLYRNLADDNVTLHTHLIRHEDAGAVPARRFRSGFAQALDETYRRSALDGRLYRNDYFVSLLVSPRSPLGTGIARKWARRGRKIPETSEGLARELEDKWIILANGLEGFRVRRLGVVERDGIAFSEIAEALRLVVTARPLPVPIISGHLGDSIYTDRVICGRRGIEIRAPDKSLFGTIFSFREYPAKTRPGMLNTLLSVPFPIVLSQSFAFVTRAQAQDRLSLKSAQMLGAQDKALSQIAGLDEAADALASNEFVMGAHHLSLAVYGTSLAEVEERAGLARGRLADAGAVVVEERLGLEAAFWSQLPGNLEWRTRPGAINSRNFAGLSSFDNFPAGEKAGHWGAPIARFRTDGGTAYDYVPHVADVAMTIIFGPIGSGKTALLMFLLAMFEQAMVPHADAEGPSPRPNGSVVFFDKDRGGELLVRATAGTYLELRRGEASGLAPLRGLKDTEADRDFLRGWLIALVQSDGKGGLAPDEEKRLERAIARQLSMPEELRSLAGLREFLGHTDPMGLGPRLEKWCRGNALGWAFDGERDDVSLDGAITGVDMTQLLEHDEVCAPAGAYLLYRVTQILDGRRVVLSIDEFRFYLKNPQFAAVVDNLLLTVRKSNGAVFLALQMPEHILESPLGPSIVAQCQTKIMFPSPTADRAVYIDGLKCTEGEYRAVREYMVVGKRRFLLKREKASVICEFDLSAMRDYVAILSGRANTVRFAEKLRRRLGDVPEQWLPEFLRSYHDAKD
ncbi:type IV secretion system protein VirB4 [Acidocella aminolytica 101 = DSM 11237]|uniref:Secretion system type IV protein VirB4 n=2 Tax=Acidocella TaxID=50709 RepID=A0A0D6PHC3_9PROT|nr:secretion system type IV protein VirB4 [Acidocella aminolytica 101 = DSM 11237]GBQ43162.1 transport secretion system IV VirB4 protein [Acidocella aminolytica 101 = DSM 11237]SHF22500.1 type IV secretion system protein VirB4 [Acidocella aminolytica 101 = DSM 11237]